MSLVDEMRKAQALYNRVLKAERMGVQRDMTPTTYVCPHCQAVSCNPNDVAQRYCGRCHKYADG